MTIEATLNTFARPLAALRESWKHSTQRPLKHCSAVIAHEIEPGSGQYSLLPTLYVWHSECWLNETTGQPLQLGGAYFWLPESHLIGTIQATKASAVAEC